MVPHVNSFENSVVVYYFQNYKRKCALKKKHEKYNFWIKDISSTMWDIDLILGALESLKSGPSNAFSNALISLILSEESVILEVQLTYGLHSTLESSKSMFLAAWR